MDSPLTHYWQADVGWSTSVGKVYARLIDSVTSDYVAGISDVYNSPVCETIDNYNSSAYYEPSYVITKAYLSGSF